MGDPFSLGLTAGSLKMSDVSGMPDNSALSRLSGVARGTQASVFGRMQGLIQEPSGSIFTASRMNNVRSAEYAPNNTVGSVLFSSMAGFNKNPANQLQIVCLHHLFLPEAALYEQLGFEDKEFMELRASMKVSVFNGILPLGVQQTSFARKQCAVVIEKEAEIRNFFGPMRHGDNIFLATEPGKAIPTILISRGNARQAVLEYYQNEAFINTNEYPFTRYDPTRGFIQGNAKFETVFELGMALEDAKENRVPSASERTANAVLKFAAGGKGSVVTADHELSKMPLLKIHYRGLIHKL